ncbi:hypothetical protein CRV08_07530 [Halarcobacter ebronensis]|uniref:Bacterial mobilisation domain-containing protein n=1 Tax=Halarcobacter ebronensis TaxID=1462615 RepID=A0A4Q0YEP1_9BACT|nr:plasmid mobilization relaxosome protein MobC [Halarcobacter ebronensis]RXJ68663.1 hypothetical protein CRV08_07530 [Halarcobacter ebronensis]
MSKYKQVKVNLTSEHHQQLLDVALKKDMTLAQYIRDSLNINLKEKPRVRKKRTDSAIYNKADPLLIYHLSMIGSNINQIAKHLNSGNSLDRVALSTLIEIRDSLDDYKY